MLVKGAPGGGRLNWNRMIQCKVSSTGHPQISSTVYPKKYAHGLVLRCFVVVMQSFIMNSHEVFIHIHQGCFAGTGAIVRLPQCQWSKPDGYGKISQCNHNKAQQSKNRVHISWDILYMCPIFKWVQWLDKYGRGAGIFSQELSPVATPYYNQAIFSNLMRWKTSQEIGEIVLKAYWFLVPTRFTAESRYKTVQINMIFTICVSHRQR